MTHRTWQQREGGSPGLNSVLVLALPFYCFVILDKSLDLSGLFASLYTKRLDLVTLLGQRLVPREVALGVWGRVDCALNSRFLQELLTPVQHLLKPPTTLAAAACIALEPGVCYHEIEGGCEVEVGILSPCIQARKQGPALADEHLQWQKQPCLGPPVPEAHPFPRH